MVLTKELFFVVAFLIHTNAAINLNFFNFNKSPAPNETTTEIPIQPTKTISTSIKITNSPTPVLNHSIPKITELPITTVNYSLPDSNDNLGVLQKHEFENETEAVNASPEITDNNTSSVPIRPDMQEIDETRNSSGYKYSVNETVLEDISNETPTMMTTTTLKPTPDLPSFPKVILPTSFTSPKRRTVQFTHTIIIKQETAYPSCVKMENVRSVCDGSLITIRPTPTVFSRPDLNTQMAVVNNDDNFDIIEPPEGRKKRSHEGMNISKTLKESESNLRVDFIEPSESDYEFEELPTGSDIKQRNGCENLQGRGSSDATQPLTVVESLLYHEPKVEFFTTYLATTSVHTITNDAATVTVIARNCIPKNLNLKKCPTSMKFETKAPIRPVKPIIYKPENTKFTSKEHKEVETERSVKPIIFKPENTKSASKEHKEVEADEKFISIKPKPSTNKPPVQYPPPGQKPFDAMEQLREYLIMNAHRLFTDKPNSYETIDLNAGSTIIQTSDTASSPLYHKKRSSRVKRQR